MNTPVPIIYIQDQDRDYLPYTLWQARQSNPKSEIIIITSPFARYYRQDFSFYNIQCYLNSFKRFSKLFVNYSTNGAEFELMCFSRWFVLYDFIHKHNIDRCFHLDADVLLYSDISELDQKIHDACMTIVGISGHSTFINNTPFFDEWIQGLFTIYGSRDRDEQLLMRMNAYHARGGNLGGVSDMTFHTENKLNHPDQVLSLEHIRPDRTVFDITLDTAMGFLVEDSGVKRIHWKDNQPYGILAEDGTLIRFHTLHFQGILKELLPFYTRPEPTEAWIARYGRNRRIALTAFKVAKKLGITGFSFR